MRSPYYSGPLVAQVTHWFDAKLRDAALPPRPSHNASFTAPLLGALAAMHEAAHAVCAHVLNQPIHSVEIAGDDRVGGEFRHHPPPSRPIDEPALVNAIVSGLEPSMAARDLWRDSLMPLAAGKAAQHRFGATHAVYDGLCADDFGKIEAVARAITATPAEMRAYLAEIEEAAAWLVEANWPAITRLGRALHESGRLDEAAISAAIAGAALPQLDALRGGSATDLPGTVAPCPFRWADFNREVEAIMDERARQRQQQAAPSRTGVVEIVYREPRCFVDPPHGPRCGWFL